MVTDVMKGFFPDETDIFRLISSLSLGAAVVASRGLRDHTERLITSVNVLLNFTSMQHSSSQILFVTK